MAEHDPLTGLHELARRGEEYAQPLPAERVRQLGQHRRTRRRIGVAAASVAAVIVAGTIWATSLPRTDNLPDVVASPTPIGSTSPTPTSGGATTPTGTPSPTPSRGPTLTEPPATEPEPADLGPQNLIAADQVPVVGEERYAETPADAGRPLKQITVCRPEGSDSAIGAQDVVSRNFRLVSRSDGEPATPDAPFGTDPTVYTQALQFASPAKARQAYNTYRRWLRNCPATLRDRGDTPVGDADEWYQVRTSAPPAAGFAEMVWRPAGESDSGYFESVGLALVDDRLAVTVSLVFGQDYNNVGYSENGDPQNGLPPHPQYGLVKAAAGRLAR